MTLNEKTRASIMAARKRAVGINFEHQVDAALVWYEMRGIAAVKKTPEPMRVIRPLAGAQFVACFTSKAQVDYSGTLRGGRAVRFDAKATSRGRIERKSVSSEQEKDLNTHYDLGADCFILCSYSPTHVYRVPWTIFRDMKARLGRQFIKEDDMHACGCERISMKDGIIHIFEREERSQCRRLKE